MYITSNLKRNVKLPIISFGPFDIGVKANNETLTNNV